MAATLVGGAALGLLLARALGGLVAVLLVATATHSALSQLGLRSRFAPLIATLVMWLGLEALIWHPPAGWYALEWANRGLLLPAEAILQRRLELGPSASGAYCVALFGLYGLSAHLAASRRDWRRLGRYLLALWVAQCAYVALLLSVADGSPGSLAMRASRLLNLDTGQFAWRGSRYPPQPAAPERKDVVIAQETMGAPTWTPTCAETCQGETCAATCQATCPDATCAETCVPRPTCTGPPDCPEATVNEVTCHHEVTCQSWGVTWCMRTCPQNPCPLGSAPAEQAPSRSPEASRGLLAGLRCVLSGIVG